MAGVAPPRKRLSSWSLSSPLRMIFFVPLTFCDSAGGERMSDLSAVFFEDLNSLVKSNNFL